MFRHGAASLKRLVVELRPPDLDILGLRTALRHYFIRMARETSLKIRFTDTTGGKVLSPETQTFLFRVVQECLINVLKHANAGYARVRLSANKQSVCLSFADDGKGFDPQAKALKQAGHLGLRAIQEMAASLSGRVNIVSSPDRGTKIDVTVPHPSKVLQGKTNRSNSGKKNHIR
jgi:signal transduction histidine kinase